MLALALPLTLPQAHADLSDVAARLHGGGQQQITGRVYKQGLVGSGEGAMRQQFAEYSPKTGELVGLINGHDAGDPRLWLSSGADFAATAAAYRSLLDSFGEERQALFQVVTVDAFRNLDYPSGIERGEPWAASRSLLVYRPGAFAGDALPEAIQLDRDKGVIVFESRYDINELDDSVYQSARSLLLDDTGRVLERSRNVIGYRVAYVRPDGGFSADEPQALYEPGDELLAPIDNAEISNGLEINGRSVSNTDGRYTSFVNIPPCPGFTWHYSIPVYAAVPYQSFNPLRSGSMNRYLFQSLSAYTCNGAPFPPVGASTVQMNDYINALTIHGMQTNLPLPADFVVDVTLLSGSFALYNEEGDAVIMGDETQYREAEAPTIDDFIEDNARDYNGDGEVDHVSDLGSIIPEYRQGAEAPDTIPHYGVWFSIPEGASIGAQGLVHDTGGELIEPDLVRAADRKPDFEPVGYLESISREDLLNTDVYVFRESTGELVAERTPFARGEGNALNGVDADDGIAFFELVIPGANARNSARYLLELERDYEAWQASLGVSEPFRGEGNGLRVGEPLKVVLINRATGYIGTASSSIEATGRIGDIAIALPDIELMPPNLKVRVERHYEVAEGLSSGEERHYLVGSESVALHSDQYVSIHTEWFDRDGSPLPAELPGYTGRVADIGVGGWFSRAETFEITPGRQIEVLRLANANATVNAIHQYIHVSGTAPHEQADFSSDPDGTFPRRPARLVPVKVPIHDETATRLLSARPGSAIDDVNRTTQDGSVYQWVYRPEMMYSIHDLSIHRLERLLGENESIDLDGADRPVLGGEDTGFLLSNSLASSEYDPLAYFGNAPEFLYSVEGHEQITSLGYSEYDLGDLGFLGRLDPADYLTINLLNNHDAGNVLWEWAFEFLSIDSLLVDEEMLDEAGTLEIPADELPLAIQAIRFGGERGSDEERLMQWTVIEGKAEISEGRRQVATREGQWQATLDIAPEAGNEVVLEGRLGDDEASAGTMRRVRVVPGLPHSIRIALAGEAYMLGHGEIEATITVRDAKNNPVADGTPVSVSVTGSARLQFEELSTVNGMARVVIVGGEQPSPDAVIRARVLDLAKAEESFAIRPLAITLNGIEGIHRRHERTAVVASVTAGGRPAAGVPIEFVASHGVVSRFEATTDASGVATLEVLQLKPDESNAATLTARAGIGATEIVNYTIAWEAADRRIESVETLLVGDQVQAGKFTHKRYDGVAIEHGYSTRSAFAIQGAPGETVPIRIGDLADPNRAPMAAWPLTTLEPSDVPLHPHTASLGPDESYRIVTDNTGASGENGFSLRASFVPIVGDSSPEAEESVILTMDGALILARLADGRAALIARTEAGEVRLLSRHPLDGSHRIEGHLADGWLSLSIDGERQEVMLRRQQLQYEGSGQYRVQAPSTHGLRVDALTFDTPAGSGSPTGSILDRTTLHRASFDRARVVEGGPLGVGHSTRIDAGGNLSIPRTEALSAPSSFGVRLDVQAPDALVKGTGSGAAGSDGTFTSTLLDLDGAMTLGYTAEGQLHLSATTNEGTATVVGRPREAGGAGYFSPGRWHTLAARFHEGTLSLYVDGVVSEVALGGELVYGGNGRYTLSAADQALLVHGLRLYDWNTKALLSLTEANGTKAAASGNVIESRSVTLDQAGRASLFVDGQGTLNGAQAGSAIKVQRVALVSGSARGYASVLSSDYYRTISGYVIEHLADAATLPPIDVGYLDRFGGSDAERLFGSLERSLRYGLVAVGDAVVPRAEAGFVDGLFGTVAFVLPVGDAVMLARQLFYLATGNPNYSTVELVGSALGTLTIIPLAKPLKPFIPGLKAVMRLTRRIDPAFFRSTAGPMGRAIKRAWKGDVQSLLHWLPTLYVFAQMTLDEESREALLFILNTIESEEDLIGWVEYLSLPTNGWEGEGLVVAGLPSGRNDRSDALILRFLVSEATAAKVNKVTRAMVSVRRLVRLISRIRGSGKIDREDARELVAAVRATTQALKKVNAEDLRGMVHTHQMLKGAEALTREGLSNLIDNARSLRVHPAVIIAVSAYLKSRKDCKTDPFDDVLDVCIPFKTYAKGNINKKLRGLYTNMFIHLAKTGANAKGSHHGIVFHLLVLAYANIKKELGIASRQPVFIEKETEIHFNRSKNKKISRQRRTDIVTAEVVEGDDDLKDVSWVEVKSVAGRNLKNKQWTSASKTRTFPHLQFSLDCLALNKNRTQSKPKQKNEVNVVLPSFFQWWYQDFGRDSRGHVAPTPAQMRRHEDSMTKMPPALHPSSFGTGAVIGNRICSTAADKSFGLFNGSGVIRDVIMNDLPDILKP
ncbi:MAG: hypothetical protein CSB44_05600 [Gammaproteobacteria bacterium]|nr:MAG: hypothetical protein CSB44_05600 [Gammaproteobacteria bacterium]